MSLSIPVAACLPYLRTLLAKFEGGWPEDAVRGLVSFAPTRHVVELSSGTRVYTYCTLDTLLIPRLLGEDAWLQSLPPGGSEALSYSIRGGQLQAPASWVVSFPRIQAGGGPDDFKGNFCPYANAFADAQAYRAWAAAEQLPTQPLSFAEADTLAQDYAAHMRASAPRVCGCGCGI